MIGFIRRNIEYFLLIGLYFWIGYCSIVNMGSIASVVFILFVVSIAIISARASFCAMLSILFGSMASLNMPSPIIVSSAIFFLFNLSRLSIRGKQLVFSYLIIPFSIYLLIRLMSCLFIVDEGLYFSALKVDFITLVSISLAVLLLNNTKDVLFTERWIGIMGVLVTIYGFFYFTYNEVAYLRDLYAGTDFAGKGVIEGADLVKAWLRWVPVDKEPNFWAAYLLFPLGYWVYNVSKKPTLCSIICLVVTLLGILFCYSRSSFLVSSLILFFAFLKGRNKYFFILLLVFFVFVIGTYLYSPDVVNRILSIGDNLKTEGGSGRFELWGEAINNFIASPILGIGTGQTPAYSPSHLGTHNLYLQILGENGIVGFSVFMFIWLSALIRMKKHFNTNGFYYFAFLGFSLNLMTVHCFDLRIPFFVMILFYISMLQRNPQFVDVNQIQYVNR